MRLRILKIDVSTLDAPEETWFLLALKSCLPPIQQLFLDGFDWPTDIDLFDATWDFSELTHLTLIRSQNDEFFQTVPTTCLQKVEMLELAASSKQPLLSSPSSNDSSTGVVDESIVQDATALRFNVLSHMSALRDLTLGLGWVTYLDLSNPALSFATGLKLLDLRARSIVDFDVAPKQRSLTSISRPSQPSSSIFRHLV